MRILLYLLLAVVALFLLGALYLAFLTEKSVVPSNDQETTYDETGEFINGFAVVTKRHPRDLWGNGQNRYGFVDAAGARITFVKYAAAYPFSEGRAYVMNTKGRVGFIDTTGQEIIPLQYVNAGFFTHGVCLVQRADDLKVGFIDLMGQPVGPFKYDKYAQLGEGKYPVGVGEQGFEKWGYVDVRGREIVAPKYDEASMFMNGYAQVGQIDPAKGLMFYGLIDSTGKEIIPMIYGNAYFNPEDGLIIVTKPYQTSDGRWHSQKGKVNLKHEFVEPLADMPD
jgi:hypothetical protein